MDVVRTGLLHVPQSDAATSAALLETLHAAGLRPVVFAESSALNQRNWIADLLCRWCDEEELDLVLTIGGTLPAPGPGAREIVPEATADVIERDLPGLGEAMRAYAQAESDLAMMERGRAGVRGRTLIVNLPRGAAPAGLFLEAIAHLIEPVLAHLREEPDAAALADALADALDAVNNPEDAALTEVADTGATGADAAERPAGGPVQDPARGLRASEFAEFLRRSAQGDAGDE